MNQEIITFWANSSFLNQACKDVQEKVNTWLRENPCIVRQMDVHHLHVNDEFIAIITLLVEKLTPIG